MVIVYEINFRLFEWRLEFKNSKIKNNNQTNFKNSLLELYFSLIN